VSAEEREASDGGRDGTSVKWTVPLADVSVDDEVLAAASDAVSSGWWSMGPRVEAFEDAFAEYCGASHAVAVSSGSAALHLALLAVGCGDKDEVVLPSLNFVAAANGIRHVGGAPVFCDIVGQDELTADPDDVEAAISADTKAIMVMHYGGFACRMTEIREIADRHGLAIVEDAAHAPGASYRGRLCGTLGDVGCFSFFANKNLPVGEGGMLVTDDDDFAQRLRLLRSHGMTTLTWDRQRGHASGYDVVMAGYNYRLDEPRAAVGLVLLGRLPAENERRRRVADRYREALNGREGLAMPFGDPVAREESSHHLAVLLLPVGLDRDWVRADLQDAGIQTSVHYPPIHLFSYFERSDQRPLPRTEEVAARLLTLPLYGALEDEQIDAVIEGVLAAVGRA
jgi:dTDP-4-amino-4,6-dideoxygalactose transaminase